MLNDFQNLLDQIDKNIKLKEINNDPILLNQTTELLSSANLLLTRIKNSNQNINNYLIEKKLEKCLNDLLSRKLILSNITEEYKKRIEKLDEDEDINLMNNHINSPNELNLMTNYNESLLTGSIKNLNNIQNNIEITTRTLKEQGDKLNEISNKTDNNEENVDIGTRFINAINCDQKCRKFMLWIINLLLTLIIILIFVYKLF